MKLSRIALALALLALVGGRVAAADDVHAGIEIGAKGVKVTVVKATAGPKGIVPVILFAGTANTSIASGVNRTGKFSADAIKETAEEVRKFYDLVGQKYNVSKENIHIVGSSGIPAAENREDLVTAVRQMTGRTLRFIDVRKEVELSILGIVPIEERAKSLLLDVGSGNTKGGCFDQPKSGDPVLLTLGLPKGTVTYTDDVKKGMGSDDFARAAVRLAPDLLGKPLADEVQRQPRLKAPTQVYFSGGIVWAMVTYLHPEGITEPYVEFSADDFDKFHLLLVSNKEVPADPNLNGVTGDEARKAIATDLRRVRDTFTRENLIAGTQVLRALAGAFDLKGKRLLFARNGYVAWITSYVVPEKKVGALHPRVQNPLFWYDAARLCSLESDVRGALTCLRTAVILGFSEVEDARVTPDLKKARAGGGDQFEAILTRVR